MKPKIAILEDSQILLSDLKGEIEKLDIAEPVICETDAISFIQKVREHTDIKIIVLDIELGQNLNGIDVANSLKMPTLFISGVTKEYLSQIENIELNFDFPIVDILKPATSEKIQKALSKLIKEVERFEQSQDTVTIKINDGFTKINQNDIVFIETITDGSNNKQIYFVNRKPAVLNDFSFSKMMEKGFDIDLFINPHQSYRVNKKRISNYTTKQLNVNCIDENGNSIVKQIPVSENNQGKIKNLLKK